MNLWDSEQRFLSDTVCGGHLTQVSSLFNHQNIYFSTEFSIFGGDGEGDNSHFSFNATEYLKNQFNPFVKENIPPMVLTVSVNHWNEWGSEKCEVHARIYDVGGIDNLWIYHGDFGDFHSFKASNNGWYNVTLDIGWGAGLLEYTIHIEAWDIAENHLIYNYTVKGLFSGVLDFVKDIWNAITGALNAAWNALKNALSWLLEWIKDVIKQALDAVLSPLKEAYNDWAKHIAPILIKLGIAFGVIPQKEISVRNIDVKQSNGDNEVLKRQAILMFLTALTAGTFGTLVMGLATVIMALEWIVTIVEYILPGGKAAAFIGDIIANIAINYGFFNLAFKLSASALIGEIIGTLLTQLIPSDSAFWAGNIPSTIVAIGVVIWQYQKTQLLGYGFGKWDLVGFVLSIIGLLLTTVLYSYHLEFWSAAIGLVVSIIGLTIALTKPSPIDEANPSIGYIDEIVDAGIVGMNAAELLASY